jgi:hypothetical protein
MRECRRATKCPRRRRIRPWHAAMSHQRSTSATVRRARRVRAASAANSRQCLPDRRVARRRPHNALARVDFFVIVRNITPKPWRAPGLLVHDGTFCDLFEPGTTGHCENAGEDSSNLSTGAGRSPTRRCKLPRDITPAFSRISAPVFPQFDRFPAPACIQINQLHSFW